MMKPIEERLWEFIDGTSTPEEKQNIEQLLQSDPAVKQLYEEFSALDHSLKASGLEEPSMRFTKNVMEQIALVPAPKPLRTKIDKRIIGGIGGFFILTLSVLFIFSLTQLNWSGSAFDFSFQIPEWDFSKIFGSWVTQAFLFFDVILGLFMLDRWLAQRRHRSEIS